MAVSDEPVDPPGDEFIRSRWISAKRGAWARECNDILSSHGAVHGGRLFEKRHQARWRAQALIDVLVGLRLRERHELAEHTEKTSGGYKWSVEYLGRHGNG